MEKVVDHLQKYPRIIFVTCDNIGSSHMQKIRLSLRGRAVLLLGKNTLMRKAIKDQLEAHPEWEAILPCIKNNVGMVFTTEKCQDLAPLLLESRVPAQAKAGIFAPQEVVLPKHITTLEPTKTTFFAALDIATKITKGCVEILNDVILCREGERVGSSEAALMAMLDIRPFTYGLKLIHVFDEGHVFPSRLLDTRPEELFQAFASGVANVAALSLALSYPSLAAFPHVVADAFKNLVAIVLGTDYSFEQAKAIKERVENPDAFAGPVTPVNNNNNNNNNTPTQTQAAPPEPSSSSEEEMGMDGFW